MTNLENLYTVIYQKNIPVDFIQLPNNESISLEDRLGGLHIAIDPDKIVDQSDETIKLCHELGHCETGAFYNHYSPFDLIEKQENKAKRWSYCHLLPLSLLIDLVASGNTEIWQIAEETRLPNEFISEAVEFYKTIYTGDIVNADDMPNEPVKLEAEPPQQPVEIKKEPTQEKPAPAQNEIMLYTFGKTIDLSKNDIDFIKKLAKGQGIKEVWV